MTAEEKLIAEGWERKATSDEPRLTELVKVYKEIGFEVHLEPFRAEDEDGCTGCLQQFPDRFKTIYTRKNRENRN